MVINDGEAEVAFPADWRTHLLTWLNKSSEFTAGATWFDGGVLVEIGDQIVWLKIYAGRVIDVRDSASVFGYTFALRGAAAAWLALLVDARAAISQSVLVGRIRVDGNQLELTRVSKMVSCIVQGLRAVRSAS